MYILSCLSFVVFYSYNMRSCLPNRFVRARSFLRALTQPSMYTAIFPLFIYLFLAHRAMLNSFHSHKIDKKNHVLSEGKCSKNVLNSNLVII